MTDAAAYTAALLKLRAARRNARCALNFYMATPDTIAPAALVAYIIEADAEAEAEDALLALVDKQSRS